jgi:PncC family amidohydrolase
MVPIEEEIRELFTASNYKVAVAESCTGGLVCKRITDVPGSSKYFLGGVVSYSNESKVSILGVPRGEVEKGAVSGEVALSMAKGVRILFGADVGIGITGIAGPGGEPVGLVYIALDSKGYSLCREFRFEGTREGIRWDASEMALLMLKEFLGRGDVDGHKDLHSHPFG